MRLDIHWTKPILLRDASAENLIYAVELSKLPQTSGIYIFGRRWGRDIEVLYIGKANNIRKRAKSQLNNLRLMQHLRNAKSGTRVLMSCRLVTKPGQRLEKSLLLVERALIRHFLAEGHDLVNKQGTRLRRHEIVSSGNHPKRLIPPLMYVEKAKGE